MSEAESDASGEVSSMATQQNQLVGNDAVEERRESERVTPELLTYVTLSEDNGENNSAGNGGMVLDVSQGGLAMATALAISDGLRLIISIPADATHPPIEVLGRVVWIAESKRRVGVQLEEVSANDRELLRRWIQAMEGRRLVGLKQAAPAIAASKDAEISSGSGVAMLPVELAAHSDEASEARPAALGEARQAAAERPQLRPELVRTLPMPAGKSGDVFARPSPVGTRPAPSVPPVVAAAVAASSRRTHLAPSVVQGRTRSENRSLVIGAALVFVVVVSFALGIVIGKDVLAQRAIRRAAAESSTTRTDNRESAGRATGAATSAPIASRSAANPAVGGPASDAAPPPITSGGATATAGVNTSKSNLDPGPAADTGSGSRDAAATGREAAGTATAGREVLVTPNEGETPLRVEFAEEVIAQSASMEIRSRRFALVPGEPPSRHSKVKKERLVLGPMISRVTPQVSASAIGSGGAQSGEQVVTVRATIAGDGHVAYVDPVSGPIALVPSVMSAVREWRYEPSALDGEPFETGVDLTITFRQSR
jgi:hypothetical protein